MENRKIEVADPYVKEDEAAAVKEVLLSGNYVSGDTVEEFENRFADYVGTDRSVAVNSGTAALHLALEILGVGPGDEVIVPPLSFFSTVSAVLFQNARPIFADIDREGFCLAPSDVRRKITPNTKAVIPVHLYGNSAEMEEILEIASEQDVYVIEDAAQAHGTEYRGEKVGAMGDIGIFSFYATKHMTTGEGGALTTDDARLARLATSLRSHGMTDRHHHRYLGYNYRMTEFAAAMGIVQLNRLDTLNEKRIENSKFLLERLKEQNINWIKVPNLKEYIKHTFFWCPIVIKERELGATTQEVRGVLANEGVETRYRYKEPLYRQPVLTRTPSTIPATTRHLECTDTVDYGNLFLENAEEIAGKILGLPNHPKLDRTKLKRVIEAIVSVDRKLYR